MKFLKSFTVLCTAVLAVTAAANESAPMQIFKKFRDAAIHNDSAAALLLTGGEMMEKIRTAGTVPADLRKQLIMTDAAYEDVHVRLNNPKKAVVYAFATIEGKFLCAQVIFTSNENSVLKITQLNVGPHIAKPHLENFLAACRANDIARYRDMITAEVTEKHPRIPASLKAGADEKISAGQATADSADFTVERSGIKGKIQMKKTDYFWKVSFIDDILLAPMPSQTVEELCRAAGRYYLVWKAEPGACTLTADERVLGTSLLLRGGNPLLPGYLAWRIRVTEKKLSGLRSAAEQDEQAIALLEHHIAIFKEAHDAC